MKVRVGSTYRFIPVGMDQWDSRAPNAVPGQLVVVRNMHGAPPANTMGHCYIFDAVSNEFLGLVLTNSLQPVSAGAQRWVDGEPERNPPRTNRRGWFFNFLLGLAREGFVAEAGWDGEETHRFLGAERDRINAVIAYVKQYDEAVVLFMLDPRAPQISGPADGFPRDRTVGGARVGHLYIVNEYQLNGPEMINDWSGKETIEGQHFYATVERLTADEA